MNCPDCGHPLHGLGTRCWAGGNGCGWYEGKVTAKPSEPLPFDREDTRSEKAIEAAIILRWEAYGAMVLKTSQYGKPRGMSIGIPDCLVLLPDGGGVVFNEIKRPKGVQSPGQKEVEAFCLEANVPYIVTRHEDAVDEFMKRRAA